MGSAVQRMHMTPPSFSTAVAATDCKTHKQLSVPVFSLATVNEDGSTNMNIVTYASPVGIEPERLWMVSLFKVRRV